MAAARNIIFLLFIGGLLSWVACDEVPLGEYIFRYPAHFGNRIQVPANNPTTKQGVYLGRRLFYESRLSANNTISCGSCHMQEKAFTDGRKLSIGVDGLPTDRNAMSIANLLWTRKFFWDGRSGSLEDQAVFPMTNPHEMGQSLVASAAKLQATEDYPPLFKIVFGEEKVTGPRIAMALAQFERSLISSNSRYDNYLQHSDTLTTAERNGMVLFNTAPDPGRGLRGANCAHCHGGPKNYLELFHNNGLDLVSKDPGRASLTGLDTDRGRFKVPTLRNIALTAPYMHDGRFDSLEEVVEHYSEHIEQSDALSSFLQNESNVKGAHSLRLSVQEKKELIAFLHTFTDTSFINNPEFSNPFLTTRKLK
ncbi:cytochrome C peroxidase [Pedobacter sp. BAL39]|uniref:cytochrome-c peroxidase n=1 Tax=Pedobacter sp. BAL39 TaxID=391596 RepID=UPI0001559983|nr:cytochrome c peroxidase [Pedobacter sp. BAL39]EDM38624.1 cytochrome C peroxidase [Pedobacter sp. BAL39]